MKILFITHHYPNYVPDLLLHGLRKLLGPNVVDYPKKDCLYNGILGLGVCPDDQRCMGWFPEDNGDIDRDDIEKKLLEDYFNCVVCDVRSILLLSKLYSKLPSRLIIIDGEDKPSKIKPGRYVVFRRETDGADLSIPLPMAIPEEILSWISSFDDVSKKYSIGFLGSTNDDGRKKIVDSIAKTYPDSLFQATSVPSDINPLPDGRLSRNDYYHNLQKCRVVLSLPGAGNDTFRFWENAACRAVHASLRFLLHIPNDFIDNQHIIRFDTIDEFKAKIDAVLDDKKQSDNMILNGRHHLVQHHLTTERARYFLDKVSHAF